MVRPPDPHGTDQIARFDNAFIWCLKWGIYPGPKYLGIRMYGTSRNSITGVLVSRRRELMCMFGIGYAKKSFSHVKGEIPRPGNITKEHWNAYKASDFDVKE